MMMNDFGVTDRGLVRTCHEIALQAAAYDAACEAEFPLDHDRDSTGLAALRRGLQTAHARKQRTLSAAAAMPATTSAGLRAKAETVLLALDALDPSPELDLARSLARDILTQGRL